jgi:hypothetical protein
MFRSSNASLLEYHDYSYTIIYRKKISYNIIAYRTKT